MGAVLPFLPSWRGCSILDLGCGTGQDAYVLSRLVGPDGRVVGIDMTNEQLEVAHRYLDYHRDAFGYTSSNVEFVHGFIEDLSSVADSSMDLVVSNCVLNLRHDKAKVFRGYSEFSPGGELYFSDIFADRRLPRSWLQDAELLGECLAGALYLEDFRRLLARWAASIRVSCRVRTWQSRTRALRKRLEVLGSFPARFARSSWILEDRCEDYGQLATYLGSMPEHRHSYVLDGHHVFITGKPMMVCGNTADMLQSTRYSRHFRVVGDKRQHFGLFDCAQPDILQVRRSAVAAEGARHLVHRRRAGDERRGALLRALTLLQAPQIAGLADVVAETFDEDFQPAQRRLRERRVALLGIRVRIDCRIGGRIGTARHRLPPARLAPSPPVSTSTPTATPLT